MYVHMPNYTYIQGVDFTLKIPAKEYVFLTKSLKLVIKQLVKEHVFELWDVFHFLS